MALLWNKNQNQFLVKFCTYFVSKRNGFQDSVDLKMPCSIEFLTHPVYLYRF